MRVHYLQHNTFVELGCIEDWLLENHHSISLTRLFESQPLPSVNDIDCLIIMGGTMSVNDETEHPWLIDEKAFIRDFIATGKPLLGICLGAQLIASALGAPVTRNPQMEIGWWPIKRTTPQTSLDVPWPDDTSIFLFHGDTFALPPGARLLASSEACANHVFQIGNNIVGIQSHPEVTRASLKTLLGNCSEYLVPDTYIQTEENIFKAADQHLPKSRQCMFNILEFLIPAH